MAASQPSAYSPSATREKRSGLDEFETEFVGFRPTDNGLTSRSPGELDREGAIDGWNKVCGDATATIRRFENDAVVTMLLTVVIGRAKNQAGAKSGGRDR